jgi:hypothetical protein
MIRELRSLGYEVELSGNPAVRIDQDFRPCLCQPRGKRKTQEEQALDARTVQRFCNGVREKRRYGGIPETAQPLERAM